VNVENEDLTSSFCGLSVDDTALPLTRTNQYIKTMPTAIQNPGNANLAPAPD
jgi:hypothetical protein